METKDNIFKRFFNFIKRILNKEQPKLLPEKTEVHTHEEQKTNFLVDLRLVKEEDPTLLKIQKQYESGEIELSILSDEQIRNLNSLYERQVSELRRKLDNQKTELNILQRELNSYSTNI